MLSPKTSRSSVFWTLLLKPRSAPLLGARDPGGSLGFPWFLLVFARSSLVFLGSKVFLGFQSLWFSTSGSLDSGVTVVLVEFDGLEGPHYIKGPPVPLPLKSF